MDAPHGRKIRHIGRLAGAVIMATLLGGPVAPAAGQMSSPGPVTVGDLGIEGAWARPSPMIDHAGAAYMVISNSGMSDDALVGASTPAADVVELHQTSQQADGTMAMQQVPSIPVPAGGSAVLEAGGYHLMLIYLVAPLEPGMTIEVTLTFESGASVSVPVEVREGGMMPGASAAPAMGG